jgi:hypothetical protein
MPTVPQNNPAKVRHYETDNVLCRLIHFISLETHR